MDKILRQHIKKKRVVAVVDCNGKKHTQLDEIVEVFTQFYEDLYATLMPDEGNPVQHVAPESSGRCVPVTPRNP